MRVALGVEYDGSEFHGWEIQRDERTVQLALERALSRVADRPVRTVCAGRTDAGVHALGQVAHIDTDAVRAERSWVFGANANLPGDVAVLWAREVPGDFHARFSAVSRSYRYLILNRETRPAALRRRVCWECRPLDAGAMARAAQSLVGEHDFSAYRAAGCQAKSPVRTLHALEVTRRGPLLAIEARANAFLQHMVRNIAGVLLAIGTGRRPVGWAGEVLASRDRRAGGVTASPFGLYLTEVEYPQAFRVNALSPRLPLW